MRELVIVVLISALSGCCLKCGPEQKSFVDVPVKLDDVKKLANPPAVVVSVERQTRSAGGGGGCGHSAACVIILPFLLYSAAFPEKYDEVTVTEGGVETFHGLYTTSGDVLSARSKVADGWREFVQLDLEALGQRAIVEAARVTTGADGGEVRTRTTLQAQVDLVGKYREALGKRSGKARGALLLEAATKLSGEGDALVLEQLGKEEPDESRAVVVQGLCAAGSDEARSERVRTFFPLVLGPGAGDETARTLLGCTLTDDALVTKAAALLARRLCTVKRVVDVNSLTRDTGRAGPARSAGIDAGVATCTKGGAMVARLALGEAVTTAAWLEALAEPEGDLIVELTSSADREKVFTGLEKRVRVPQLVKLAASSSAPLEEREAKALVAVAFEQPDTPAGWQTRAAIGEALRGSATSPGGLALKASLPKTSGANAKTAQCYLARLGDKAARDALASTLTQEQARAYFAVTVDDETELVMATVVEEGCARKALELGQGVKACR